jgi:uncharacterized delta-60 repeat protein
MTLITRQGKGEKITIEEMDNNLLYIEQYRAPDITGITSNLQPFVEDKIDYINKITLSDKKILYKGLLYNESQSPIREINLKYNESEINQVDIENTTGNLYHITGTLSTMINGIYDKNIIFNSTVKPNPIYDPNNIELPFEIGSGFNQDVTSIALQPDGKILAGGWFTSYNGTIANRIIRLNTGGTIDNTFFIGNGFNSVVNIIKLQPDGKVLVGGWFTSYNGTIANKIIRLNSDGSIDKTFNIGTGFDGDVNTIALQPDGKILVGGNFTSYNSTFSNYIIRLNSDGTIDGTFNIGSGFNSVVNIIKLQPDGKILVGGNFTSYNSTFSNYIIRLNSDGTIDNTFNIGNGFNGGVYTIALQPDGKILVGGFFNNYNSTFSTYIIRLNSDGTIDNTFNIGNGFNDGVLSIALQPDGKILVGGFFTFYNGTFRNRIIRLNSDGTIDNTFNIGSGFNGGVTSIALQPDGKILVGGYFNNYNGTFSNYIIRLNSDGSSAPPVPFIYTNNYIYNTDNLSFTMDIINNKLVLNSNFDIYRYTLDFKLYEIEI